MKRREAIYNFVLISAGVMLLPSCGQQQSATIPLKNISLTGTEEKLLMQLTDLLIPKTNFVGATDVKATEFTLTMMDDCNPPDKQQLFKNGLVQFDKFSKHKYGKSFVDCTPAIQKELLKAIEAKKDIPENVAQFYATTKGYTLQAFMSSKEYLTDVAKYKIVPGSNFKGCVPVKQA